MKRLAILVAAALCAVLAGGATRVVQDQCGPFTDVTPAFCPYILELYYLGITAGTSATTFSPDDPLTRGQGAVFIAKGLNQSLARSSRRAALGQWWTTTPASHASLAIPFPDLVRFDGADLWVTSNRGGTVTRVRASDGRLLETWTGVDNALGILCAMGRVFVTKFASSGALYMIDPSQAPVAPTVVAELPSNPFALAFDGDRIWCAHPNSISIITPGPTIPWTVTTVSQGFTFVNDLVYDGASVWAADDSGFLLKLSPLGAVVQTVPVGPEPSALVFDGANIWTALLHGDAVVVVSAGTGQIVSTLTGNGLGNPNAAGFDGERVMVSNFGNNHLSLWNAADLRPLGSFQPSTGLTPGSVCSDGVAFWVTMGDSDELVRF